MICVDQSREGLTGDKSVFEELSGGFDTLALGTAEVNSRAYCSWFGFSGQAQQKKLDKLSGGERNRVQLAKVAPPRLHSPRCDEPMPTTHHAATNTCPPLTMPPLTRATTHHALLTRATSHDGKVLKSGGNVLLLDEPTNDLDVNTMRSLEEVSCSTDRWRTLTTDYRLLTLTT